MNIIDNTLAKHGLTQDELPKKVQIRIDHILETQEEIAATKADLKVETDEDIKQEMIETIEKAEEYVETLTQQVVQTIEEMVEAAKDKQQPPAPAPPPIITSAASQSQEQPKKKGSAMPWILGGVLLVLTLGAVNVMSEK